MYAWQAFYPGASWEMYFIIVIINIIDPKIHQLLAFMTSNYLKALQE